MAEATACAIVVGGTVISIWKRSAQKDPKVIYSFPFTDCRFPSMALKLLLETDSMPVLPRSVQEPTSIVVDVATPMAETWLPKDPTE